MIEATKAYKTYVEEPKTSQRRERLDLELELLPQEKPTHVGFSCGQKL